MKTFQSKISIHQQIFKTNKMPNSIIFFTINKLYGTSISFQSEGRTVSKGHLKKPKAGVGKIL